MPTIFHLLSAVNADECSQLVVTLLERVHGDAPALAQLLAPPLTQLLCGDQHRRYVKKVRARKDACCLLNRR
jgi:hypothetical protein